MLLWLVTCSKLVAEVALMSMLGRFVLSLIAGTHHRNNPFWRILDWVVAPFERTAAKFNAGGNTVVATAVGLLLCWLLATGVKIWLCLSPNATSVCQ